MLSIWKLAKIIALSLLALALALLGSGIAYRTYRQHQVAKTTAIDAASGIDETLFARIGGVDQWISIRGQRRDNPVLLIVHGGPGLALSPVPRTTLFDWTRDFTIVLWDQRGAGKTFGRSGPGGADVTIERMVLDGVEVAELLCRKLHKPKIILVGVSWGSMLGVHMVKTRPDLFYAYVGTGQSVHQHKDKAVAYAQLLAEARARNDQRAIDELEANGPPPYDSISKETVYTKWATAYEPAGPSRWTLVSTVLFESEVGLRDLRDYVSGLRSSSDHFREQIQAVDLTSLGTDFAVPFFVFQGAVDNVTPVQPVKDYLDHITAPHKELVLIPDGGHDAMATKRDAFLALLVERVRPLATQNGPAGPALPAQPALPALPPGRPPVASGKRQPVALARAPHGVSRVGFEDAVGPRPARAEQGEAFLAVLGKVAARVALIHRARDQARCTGEAPTLQAAVRQVDACSQAGSQNVLVLCDLERVLGPVGQPEHHAAGHRRWRHVAQRPRSCTSQPLTAVPTNPDRLASMR